MMDKSKSLQKYLMKERNGNITHDGSCNSRPNFILLK